MDELCKWVAKYKVARVFWSYKLDGMSFVAEYVSGSLISLATRGDGITGESILNKAPYIVIPMSVNKAFTGTVRGELVLEGDSHKQLGYKNRRNGVVGCVKEDSINPNKLIHVVAYAYQILDFINPVPVQFDYLEELGFETPPHGYLPADERLEEELKICTLQIQDFDFDGIVISTPEYNNENVYFPELQVAFKVNSEGVPCKVTGITWDVSKNRLLKPVIQIEPTEIDGATITNVTGYNAKWVMTNKIETGTTVLVVRSGQVIPKIIGVVA
jgi:DNA ligase (NAD+)